MNGYDIVYGTSGSKLYVGPTSINLIAGSIRFQTPEGTYNSFKPAYGQFYSTTLQNIGAVASPLNLQYSGTSISQNITYDSAGISSRITVEFAGVYRIQYRIQISRTNAGTGAQVFSFIKVDGFAIANTTTTNYLPSGVDPAIEIVISAENIITLTAGQYFEIAFASDDATIRAFPYTPGSPVPASPSVITNVNRIK